MTYTPPLRDIRYTLDHICGFSDVLNIDAFNEIDSDLIEAILAQCGKMTSEVLAPLNQSGDKIGAQLENGRVRMPEGFAEAYAEYAQGGWNGLSADTAYGGQGLPQTLAFACLEMVEAANLGFGVCGVLNLGAIHALSQHGTEAQKETYLTKLISGEWTGTMNMTEPQAGSDVGALRTRAEPHSDGSYKIFGTKIFISYGDHDMADNIVHLVLARLPDAPAGSRGISLFIVPKILVNEDGSLGAANDLKPVGVEHKLGIKASPTCVMSFGENDGAVGYLIGEENKGLACMFTMMNSARLSMGFQGVGVAERAYQQALAFAQERKQGKSADPSSSSNEAVPIIQHADIRRNLYTMKAQIEACRALCLANAAAIDLARFHPDDATRKKYKAREELLTPIAKSIPTDMGVEVTSLAIQIHGGMGFIEETGVAQYYRDIRIAPIYEGTNGIQAIDLVTRKLSLNGGEAIDDFLAEMGETVPLLKQTGDATCILIAEQIDAALKPLRQTTDWLRSHLKNDLQKCLAGATPYQTLLGRVACAHFLGRGALKAHQLLADNATDKDFFKTRIQIAHFFAENILPQVHGLASAVTYGDEALFALSPEQLGT